MKISYKKILLKIIPLMTGIVLVLYLLLSYGFERSSAKELAISATNNLQSGYDRVELLNLSVENCGLSLLYDNEIAPILYGNPDYFEKIEGVKKLQLMKNISPYIDSIYIWNETTQKIYSTIGASICSKDNFFDSEIFKIIEDRTFKNPKVISRKIPEITFESAEKAVYSYIYYDNIAGSAIVMNVLISTVNDMFYETGGETLIVDSQGILLNSCQSGMAFSDVSDNSFVKIALEQQETKGYFITKADEKKLVVYITDQKSGNIYIKMYSYSQINSEIIKMRNTSLIITLLVLVVGVLLSGKVSGTIYRPIDEICMNLKKLETEKKKNAYRLRQQLLRMIFDEPGMDQEQLAEKFKQNGIEMKTEGHFVLSMFKIDDYSVFCQNYSVKDRELWCFAIANIASEIMNSAFQCEAVEVLEYQVVLIIRLNGVSKEYEKEQIHSLCCDIQDKVKDLLGISVSCIFSPYAAFSKLPLLYGEIKEVEQYRMYLGKACTFNVLDIDGKKSNDYIYPFEIEKKLITELNYGNVEKAKQWYLQIVDSLYFYPTNELSATLLRLLVAIYKELPTFEYRDSRTMYHYNDLASKIVQCEVVEDINQLFFGFFEAIVENQTIWRDSKHNQLIDKIKQIIKDESEDVNLSLELIAEKLSLTSDYTGKLFKKYTGKSIVNYINEERMENAKSFLIETNLTVKEISDKVGFATNRYFLTLFKKMHGLTPTEFRNMYKRE